MEIQINKLYELLGKQALANDLLQQEITDLKKVIKELQEQLKEKK